MTSVRIGLIPWSGRGSASDPERGFLRHARLADELDLHSVWLPEGHFDTAACPSPLILLAAAAACTSKLRLGTTSTLLSIRNPIHVAEEVAVLDHLSGGRVLLGVGRGFRAALFSGFGVPESEKRDRFEAALEIVLRAWRGEPIAGEAIRVTPRPVQKPHPPVWVAAFGPKALAQAGRLGLPYLASPVEPIDRLEENYARHAAALPSDQTDPLPVPVIRTLFVSRDGAQVEAVRSGLEQQARELAERAGGRFAELAGRPAADWALVGSPDEVTRGIATYRERIGLTHLIARIHVPGATLPEIETSLRLLSQEVRSRL
ncbi:MAG: LLM class flavin-dependent oxidoreductase [Myxococcota bacterium]